MNRSLLGYLALAPALAVSAGSPEVVEVLVGHHAELDARAGNGHQ